MAAEEEPGEVERPAASEDRAAGRAEAGRHCGRRESEFAGLVWVFPAQPSEHVCDGGRLRETATAEPAAMAPRWPRVWEGSGASTLAECMVCPPWAAVLGSGTRVDASNRRFTNPLTGEPDAGNPPVRFGGRGKVNPLSLPYPGLNRIVPAKSNWAALPAKTKRRPLSEPPLRRVCFLMLKCPF